MKIKEVIVWPVDIPLRFSFKHALADHATSASIIVKLILDNGIYGHGEALPRAYVTGETVESCLLAIQKLIVPRLTGLEFIDNKDLEEAIFRLHELPELSGATAAICAVELALIDALARSRKQTVYEFLGKRRKAGSVRYSMVLGSTSQTKLRKLTWLTRALGISDVKLKVGPSLEENENAICQLKRIHPRANVRVDANCAWTIESARHNLDMMRIYAVLSCEQPLEKHDIEGQARLVQEYPDVLICADESLCSYDDAETLVREKAATCFNIRISKNGGLLNAMRIYQLAKENDVECQLGAQVGETAIISAAGRYFAGMTGDLRFHEGSFGTRLLKTDLTRQPYRFGLGGKASTRCRDRGLGVHVRQRRLAQFAGTAIRIACGHKYASDAMRYSKPQAEEQIG